MYKMKFIVSGFALLFLLSFKSDKLPKDFSELLTRAKITFIRTEGMVETKCIENRQMNYEYALKLKDKNFEVRYAIRPMDVRLNEYDETKKKKNEMMIHPNNWSQPLFQTTLLNIGIGGSETGNLPNITYFDSTAVRHEFNADWGATAFVNLGPEFGGNTYKYCIAVTIHKDFVGDAYFFYVSDNKDDIGRLMEKPFHSLKFK